MLKYASLGEKKILAEDFISEEINTAEFQTTQENFIFWPLVIPSSQLTQKIHSTPHFRDNRELLIEFL